MSVIFGIKDPDTKPSRIVICGDKRASTVKGDFVNDEMNKITVINEKLAFASAGNASIEFAIKVDCDKSEAKVQTTDDLLGIIIAFYNRVKTLKLTAIEAMPFYGILAGENNNGEPSLVGVSYIKGNLTYKEVPMTLYPPCDMTHQSCANIFVKHYRLNHSKFCEKTVCEIAETSKVVSPSGTIWIYDYSTRIGSLQEF